jgi:hypothetical protein
MITALSHWFSNRSVLTDTYTNLASVGPEPFKLLWVDPLAVTTYCALGRQLTGTVRDGTWDIDATPIESNAKIRACLSHWRDGVPWLEMTSLFRKSFFEASFNAFC